MPLQYALPPGRVLAARVIESALGRFAPGQLGGLTAFVPFELVDAVLDEHGGQQRRLRDLPSRVGVFFLLAMCLFPEVGYGRVWRKLTAGLAGHALAAPSAKVLRDLRRRIGAAPMRRLCEVLCGPLAQPHTPGVRFGHYRLVSFDGCSSIKAPDTERNRAWLGTGYAYPMVELMTLVESGTRSLIGAVFGPTAESETTYATRLLHHLCPDMLVLWDRGFDSNAFFAAAASTGTQILGRLNSRRRPPVLQRLHDGSYLSVLGTLPVRIIEAHITVSCADGGSFTGPYRLATTLTCARRYSAGALVRLYHQRWEHESAYYALRHTIMQGRVLRSGDPAGLEQEIWSVLALYQLLRTAMVEATEARPGTDPDRCSFTTAVQTTREQIGQAPATRAPASGPTDALIQRLQDDLLPPRRLRVSTRKVKSPISRYHERLPDGRPDRSRAVTRLDIAVLAPPESAELPTATALEWHLAPGGRRRERVLELIRQYPARLWSPSELARHLGDVTLPSLHRQLNRWADDGLIDKPRRGRYSATNDPSSTRLTSSDER